MSFFSRLNPATVLGGFALAGACFFSPMKSEAKNMTPDEIRALERDAVQSAMVIADGVQLPELLKVMQNFIKRMPLDTVSFDTYSTAKDRATGVPVSLLKGKLQDGSNLVVAMDHGIERARIVNDQDLMALAIEKKNGTLKVTYQQAIDEGGNIFAVLENSMDLETREMTAAKGISFFSRFSNRQLASLQPTESFLNEKDMRGFETYLRLFIEGAQDAKQGALGPDSLQRPQSYGFTSKPLITP